MPPLVAPRSHNLLNFGMHNLNHCSLNPTTSSTSPRERPAIDSTQVSSAECPAVTRTSADIVTKQTILGTSVHSKPLQVSNLEPPQPLPVNISTPVNIPYFARCLTHHPDQKLVKYFVNGLTHGFDIGTNFSPHTPSHPINHRSARDHPEEVTAAIAKELRNGHIAGPFASPPWPNLHCSPLGARIKDDGSYRLIMDLSYPHGDSVNDLISKEDFPVEFTGFDTAADMVRTRGRNCLMFKIDIKHAFRVLPIRPSQWILMGIEWMGYYFVDFRLPFGLRSSPGIFNRFADVICWILQNIYNLKLTIHYSDDYFFIALHPNSAQQEFDTAIQAFKDLGLPVAMEKTVPPTTQLPFLGIDLDSSDLTMSVPEAKKTDILQLLRSWEGRRKCTKTELLNLTGKLQHICKVVRPGRTFLRRLWDLTRNIKRGHHHISLNQCARADISWWIHFLPEWSRSTIIPETFEIRDSDLHLFTDASKLGLGGIYGNQWIQARWPKNMAALNKGSAIDIDYLELFAIYAACATWGHEWTGKRIVIHTDNMPITDVWQAGTSKSPLLMGLVRKVFFEAAKNQFTLSLKFIPGKHNTIADDISRFQMERLKSLVPEADPLPTQLPARVIHLLTQ